MKTVSDFTKKVFFIPTLYSSLGFFLAAIVIAGDYWLGPDLTRSIPEFFYLSSGLTQGLFVALVGALLAMITVSFSTMMVVLTLYSAQFSPRITRDFLERKVSLRVLGLFMGSFIYSLLGLYASDGPVGDAFILMPVVGMMLAIACLGAFGYFIFHVAKSVQINNIIEKITGDILRQVEKTIEINQSDDRVQTQLEQSPEGLEGEMYTEVPAGDWGFIGKIDEKGLLKLATKHDCMFHLKKHLGDFVQGDDVLANVFRYTGKKDGTGKDGANAQLTREELVKEIQDKFSLGEERNTEQDVEFGITKLVEIGLRAISPGINDPNTAIYCISKLGPILRKIGTELERRYYLDDRDTLRLHVPYISFEPLLYSTYFQLRTYGKNDVSVLGALIDSLIGIVNKEGYEDREMIWKMCLYLVEEVGCIDFPSLDLDYLNDRIRKLGLLTGQDAEPALLRKSGERNCSLPGSV